MRCERYTRWVIELIHLLETKGIYAPPVDVHSLCSFIGISTNGFTKSIEGRVMLAEYLGVEKKVRFPQAFASELLIPVHTISTYLEASNGDINTLAKIYCVSPAMMAKRIIKLLEHE